MVKSVHTPNLIFLLGEIVLSDNEVSAIKNEKISSDSKSAGSFWSEKRYDIKKLD